MRVRPIRAGGANVMCAALAFGPVLVVDAQAQGSAIQTPDPRASATQGTPAAPVSGATAAQTPTAQTPQQPTLQPPATPPLSDMTLDRTLSNLRQGSSPQQGVPVPTSMGKVQRNIYLGLSASAIYDDNATRSNSSRPLQSDLSKRDVVFPIGAQVNLVVPSGANLYILQGSLGYDFNLRNTRLDSEDVALTGGYRRSFRGCDGGLNAGFARGRTQFQDTFLSLDKNLQTTETIGASLSCNVTFGLRPFGSFDYLRARNSQLLRGYSDHDTKTFGGGIVDYIPAIGEVGIVASIEDTVYPNRAPGQAIGARQLRVKSLGVSFNRAVARILQAQVRLNYTMVEDNRAGNGSFKGLSGNAVIRYMPGGRFTFTATGSRAATPSLSFNSDYDLNTNFDLTAVARIGGRTSARISYAYQYRKFFGVVAVLPGLDLRNDTNISYSAGVSRQLRPKIALQASVIHQKRTANRAIFNYSGTRATIGVNVQY